MARLWDLSHGETQIDTELGVDVKGTVPLYLAGASFGLLLAGVSAWCGSSSQPPRISPELARSPLVAARTGQGDPEPPSFIRSIEVTRPGAVELTVIPSPPRERLAAVELPLPVCDEPPRALLRAGCPQAPPEVGPCAEEGLECRYPTAEACVAQYRCLYGLWSPLAVVCPDAERGQLLSGSGQCEANTPVADAPCADEGLICVHAPCGYGDAETVAECRCGRWYTRRQQCPLTR